jgi:hypothetical protein
MSLSIFARLGRSGLRIRRHCRAKSAMTGGRKAWIAKSALFSMHCASFGNL